MSTNLTGQHDSAFCACDMCRWTDEQERKHLAKRETMADCPRCHGAGEIEVEITRGVSSASLVQDFQSVPCPARCENGKVEVIAEEIDPIPDTDLVRIAEREVIERAKAWKGAHSTRASENLFAAVSLLESRERLLREGK
jgi:hypothetical protein